MTARRKRLPRRERREQLALTHFGRFVPWMPAELPAEAHSLWPTKNDWPIDEDIKHFLAETEDSPDIRLAVLSGLRRWAEPASSQMLVAFVSIFVSIAAVAIASSNINEILYALIVGAGAAYVIMALIGIEVAMQMDERRKMAFVWLRAVEDAVMLGAKQRRRCVPLVFSRSSGSRRS